MTVELLRVRTAPRVDPDLEITLLVSLLGLTLTLVVLPLIGGDVGALLAFAG